MKNFLKGLFDLLCYMSGGWSLLVFVLSCMHIQVPSVILIITLVMIVLNIISITISLIRFNHDSSESVEDELIPQTITLSMYSKYDENLDEDYIVYEVKYEDGRVEYVSKDVYNIIKAYYTEEYDE